MPQLCRDGDHVGIGALASQIIVSGNCNGGVIRRQARQHQDRVLTLSADGTFIHLTNGEWREVKCIAAGEFESR